MQMPQLYSPRRRSFGRKVAIVISRTHGKHRGFLSIREKYIIQRVSECHLFYLLPIDMSPNMKHLRKKDVLRLTPVSSGKSYIGAKPLVGHGEHRYLYQVIALNEPLDLALLGEKPSKAKIAEAIKGKVAGWGVWMGRYNRTPEQLT